MDPQQQQSSDGSTQVELRTDGFQATLLWERIVSHLERSVKPGRHSYALRSYENCFPGHKVVDCLMGYMNSVLPKSVKKSQARLLGQKLLLTRVIEDARKKEKTVFRGSRLYRFTGIHFWDPPSEVHGTRSCSVAATEVKTEFSPSTHICCLICILCVSTIQFIANSLFRFPDPHGTLCVYSPCVLDFVPRSFCALAAFCE